jgi:hypothetical protein
MLLIFQGLIMSDGVVPTPPDRAEPGQLARFDQAFALINEHLDALIGAHRQQLAEAKASPEIDLAALAVFIHDNTDHVSASEILAGAIWRLVRGERSHG